MNFHLLGPTGTRLHPGGPFCPTLSPQTLGLGYSRGKMSHTCSCATMEFVSVKLQGRYRGVALRHVRLLQFSNKAGGGMNSWLRTLVLCGEHQWYGGSTSIAHHQNRLRKPALAVTLSNPTSARAKFLNTVRPKREAICHVGSVTPLGCYEQQKNQVNAKASFKLQCAFQKGAQMTRFNK